MVLSFVRMDEWGELLNCVHVVQTADVGSFLLAGYLVAISSIFYFSFNDKISDHGKTPVSTTSVWLFCPEHPHAHRATVRSVHLI